MEQNILSLFKDDNDLDKASIERIRNVLQEFDYATKYLSRKLKVRPFVVYLLLFKKAYFEVGQKKITVKLAEIGENLLSDIGKPMSHDVIKRGVNELVQKGYVYKYPGRPGEINQYDILLPSEIREVKELIAVENSTDTNKPNEEIVDYYTNQEKRILILERDNYKCNYCMKELDKDDFYLDHIFPRTQGGYNYRSNLLAACHSCNTKKNDKDVDEFLMSNYRSGLLTQNEFLHQKDKIHKLMDVYREAIKSE
jgi:hypothetical protein